MFDVLIDKSIRGVLRFIAILLFITIALFAGCTVQPPPPITPVTPIKPVNAKRIPTAPVAIDPFHVALTGASADERRMINNALGFIAARTPSIFTENYCRAIVMRADNNDHHFDDIHIPNIAGHYEPGEKIVCVWRGKLDISLLFHESEHPLNALRDNSTDGRAVIASWDDTTRHPVYGYEFYPEWKSIRTPFGVIRFRIFQFPYRTFPTRYATRNAEEHRAEWKRYLYLFLYEEWLHSTGDKTVYAYNHLKQFKPDAQFRELVKWSLDVHDITPDDCKVVREYFKFPNEDAPKK